MRRLIHFAMFIALVFAGALSQAAAGARDYFARFKYDAKTAIETLKKAEGQELLNSAEATALLEDLGYWKEVRQSGVFHLTTDLQERIEAQYKYLSKAFRYEKGDTVWVSSTGQMDLTYGVGRVNHRAQIVDHLRTGDTDFYVVDIYTDGPGKMQKRVGTYYDGRKGEIIYYGDNYQLEKATRVFTKTELDALNSPGSSLPQDNQGEKIDWVNDQVWLEKLESFKDKMAQNGFSIDFRESPDVIQAKQQELMVQIFRHFKMNRNAMSQSGRGLGLRASGGGVCFDQALVLTYAIQGVGQTLGIKAFNLNGTTVNPQGGHGFVRYELKTLLQTQNFDRVWAYEHWESEYKKAKHIEKQSGVPLLSLKLDSALAIYQGVDVRTSTWTGISDPGWADYGVTPDFFARVPVNEALNPIPVDSNRAVHGLSSQRNLVDVAQQIKAQGPMNTYRKQALAKMDEAMRTEILKEYQNEKAKENSTSLMSAIFKVMNVKTPICAKVMGM
ncbi:MAG: hypothetical protein BroJett040_16130 [Oligoflexia bacterium]|nr:MAG: hypothetical protein BroJett040_16130 [Oligoflexia bacterium]